MTTPSPTGPTHPPQAYTWANLHTRTIGTDETEITGTTMEEEEVEVEATEGVEGGTDPLHHTTAADPGVATTGPDRGHTLPGDTRQNNK